MEEHVLFRIIRLRAKLKGMPPTEHTEEVLCQLNVIMHRLLNNQVCIDFTPGGDHAGMVVPKLAELIRTSEAQGDGTCADLQAIMSSCISSTLMRAAEAPLPCHAMPTAAKMQHMRSSLELIL
jgi:hypothetical protein